MWADARADRPGRRHRRLPPLRLDARRTRRCASGSAARPRARGLDVDDRPRRQPVGLVGRPGRRRARASCSAATWTRCPTAARSTARSASCRAFAALDALRDRGFRPGRPIGVVNFADEEGARFGVACAGSRLLTGALDPDRARALTDADGTTMAEAMARGRARPGAPRPRRRDAAPDRHVRRAARRAGPRRWSTSTRRSRSASAIWPHGRWRLDLRGRGQPRRHHPAGRPATTRCSRCAAVDPGRPRGRRAARRAWPPSARCGSSPTASTRSRRRSPPGSTPAAAARTTSRAVVADVGRRPARHATPRRGVLDRRRPPSTPRSARPARPRCSATRRCSPTGAGHDAGILAAAGVPTAMLFVRNPTGVSHSPAEHAEAADCLAGVDALARGASRSSRGDGYWCEHALAADARPRSPDVPRRGRRTAGSPPSTPGAEPGARRRPGCPASCCPASRTRTRTPSTARCAAAPTTAAAPSGPGASGCTPSPRGSTPTATSRWPGRRTPRWRWPGSPASASSTTCTTPPGGGRYADPNAMARGAGRRPPPTPASGSPCSTPATSPAASTAPGTCRSTTSSARFSDGDADAWADAGRRTCAEPAGRCGSAPPSTRCAPCRATQLPTVAAAADRAAAARAPVRAAGRERGLPGVLRPHADRAARPTPACSGRDTTAVHATHLTADDIAAARRDRRRRSASARRPSATSPTASARPARCATPARRCASAATSTRDRPVRGGRGARAARAAGHRRSAAASGRPSWSTALTADGHRASAGRTPAGSQAGRAGRPGRRRGSTAVRTAGAAPASWSWPPRAADVAHRRRRRPAWSSPTGGTCSATSARLLTDAIGPLWAAR